MNFAGHVAVAEALIGPVAAPSHLVGAALPDLAAMGRFRLRGRPADGELAAGIAVHHRTDEAFHRHRWFRHHSSAVSSRLEGDGLGRGAARACGHVGVELLLDGHLLGLLPDLSTSVRAAIEGAGRRAESLAPLVAEAQRTGWRDHLTRLAAWPVPDDYDEPAAVAARLQRILSRRPRLAFAPAQTPLVTRALADQHPALTEGAAPLLDDLLGELRERTGPRP